MAGANGRILQPLAQFFSSQLINTEWLQPGGAVHEIYSAGSDIRDSVGHMVVTAYAVKRPDQQWALLIVNKDQENSYRVKVNFRNDQTGGDASFAGSVDTFTFGSTQYKWDPLRKTAHPDGPVLKSSTQSDAPVDVPAATIVVLRGKVAYR